jgi:8-oxo-dGTP pyrophosphatase MutT (NUDIX family)
MSRQSLLSLLLQHTPEDDHEAAMLTRIVAFVQRHPDCFERSLPIGHVTASAWIVDLDRTHALLTHHAKLDKWLQMGGHCDGDPDVLRVALREVEEESGLSNPGILLGGAIFDVDAHEIPARGETPAHIHHDIRFLFEADRRLPLRISDESHDLRWVAFEEVPSLNTDESVLRMVSKTIGPGHSI